MTSSPRPPHVDGRPDPTGGTTAHGGESAPGSRYLLDNARAEAGERFAWLAELFDGVTRGHSDRLGESGPARAAGKWGPVADAGVPLFVTDPQTAELAKGAANTYLGLKISFANAVADMCEAAGGDIAQIVDILGIDPRIGGVGMRPGLGYGGGCLPKDIRAFTASARQLGAEDAADLLRSAEKINESRTAGALDLITRTLGGRPLKGARVTVWGAAFKPGTNDVRESPALALARSLQEAGATVIVHDPQAVATAVTRNPELDYTDDLPGSVDGADVVVLATEWPDYRQADPHALVDRPADPLLVDCRTTLDPEPWRTAGWRVRQLGRPGK